MAEFRKNAFGVYTAQAGELINIAIERQDFEPNNWFVNLSFGMNLSRQLGGSTGYKKLKQAKREARREAIRMLALAITDINFTGPEGGSE